jgi:lactoylglutathione lyase
VQAAGYVFVELYVEDSRCYLRIFRDALGFEVVRDEGDWVELRSREGHGTVILNQFDDPDAGHPFERYRDAPRRGVGVEIGIVVDDVRSAWERARRIEGCEVTDIVRQEWGMTDFRILTPHGYYLRVTEPRR